MSNPLPVGTGEGQEARREFAAIACSEPDCGLVEVSQERVCPSCGEPTVPVRTISRYECTECGEPAAGVSPACEHDSLGVAVYVQMQAAVTCRPTWPAITKPPPRRAFFASEWGIDFRDVRVVKHWYAPPEPECDECGERIATCGVEATWAGGPTFTSPVCSECQAAVVARQEGIYGRLSAATAKTLEDVEPYDGWPVMSATPTTPGAVAYWHGEDPDA